MKCPKCGEVYQGLAGDCRCTDYGRVGNQSFSEWASNRLWKPDWREGTKVRILPSYQERQELSTYEELKRLEYAAEKRRAIERLAAEAAEFAKKNNVAVVMTQQKNRKVCSNCGTTTGGDGVPCVVCFKPKKIEPTPPLSGRAPLVLEGGLV